MPARLQRRPAAPAPLHPPGPAQPRPAPPNSLLGLRGRGLFTTCLTRASLSCAAGPGLHVGSVDKLPTGDHGGIRGPAAAEALLSATCSLQPHGGPYAALVSEQSREQEGGRNTQSGPQQPGTAIGLGRLGGFRIDREDRLGDVDFGGGSGRFGGGRGGGGVAF